MIRKGYQISFVLIVSLLFLSVNGSFAQTGKVIKSFNAPGGYCTGLTFDGQNLWVADRKSDKIYKLDSETGNVLQTIESPAYYPTGLTWDGRSLWNSDIRGTSDISENLDGKIFQVDPETGIILKTLKSPATSPRGIAWDGKYLWCVDEKKDIVIQLSTLDGATINSFPSP